jgi:membrane protease YdiL (CAAX protease family)
VNDGVEIGPSQPPPAPATVEQGAEPVSREGGEQVGWGPARTLGGLAALLVLLVIEVAVVAAIFDPDLDSLASRLVLQATLAATLVGVAFAVAGLTANGGLSAAGALGLRRPTGKFIGPSLIAYFGYLACALVIAALIQPEQEDVTRELGVDEGVLGAIAAGVLVIGVAPFSEEVFFRGFMFTGMRRALPFVLAALIPSVIWGLFHYTGPESWGVVLQLSIFGLWLCWLYQRTGSLWPPIVVHALNNAIAFAILTG